MNKEQIKKLITLYGVYPWLWDARDPNYTNRGLREDAWRQISAEMEISVSELKKKMESLLGSYRREKSREKKSRITGSGRDDIYKSNWFAYEYFAFMTDRHDPGVTRETLDVEIIVDEDDTIYTSTGEQPNDEVVTEQSPRPVKAKKRKAKEVEPQDETLSNAFKILEQCVQPTTTQDPYTGFGMYVGNELRKYDPLTLAHVKNKINNILFEADTGAYNNIAYYEQYAYARPSSSSSSYSSMPPSPMAPPVKFGHGIYEYLT